MKKNKSNIGIAAITTKSILRKESEILFVSHDLEDGSWQFLDTKSFPDVSQASVVSLENIYSLDPSIKEIMDLPLGWSASRKSIRNEWHRNNPKP